MKINIDKLFQNKIKELKVTPPYGVWSSIETKLKRRRMLRFFGVSFVSLMSFMFLFSHAELRGLQMGLGWDKKPLITSIDTLRAE